MMSMSFEKDVCHSRMSMQMISLQGLTKGLFLWSMQMVILDDKGY